MCLFHEWNNFVNESNFEWRDGVTNNWRSEGNFLRRHDNNNNNDADDVDDVSNVNYDTKPPQFGA